MLVCDACSLHPVSAAPATVEFFKLRHVRFRAIARAAPILPHQQDFGVQAPSPLPVGPEIDFCAFIIPAQIQRLMLMKPRFVFIEALYIGNQFPVLYLFLHRFLPLGYTINVLHVYTGHSEYN